MIEFEQFKHKFIEDAGELIANLEKDLLELEKNPENNELVEQIFRVMHTLKGVSSMYGFENIGEFTHYLENVYDTIRDGKLKVSNQVLDLTFEAVDHIQNMLHETVDADTIEGKRSQLNAKIAHLLTEAGKEMEEPPKAVSKKSASAKKTEKKESKIKTWYIVFRPNENMLKRGINIPSIFHDLSQLGRFQIINHLFSDFHQNIDEEESAWGIFLATSASLLEIEDALFFVLDDCKILKLSDYNLFNKEDFIERIENEPLGEDDSFFGSSFVNAEIEDDEKEDEFLEEMTPDTAESEPKEGADNSENEFNDYENRFDDFGTDKEVDINKEYKIIGRQITSRISVDAAKLDRLMYLVSELVTTKAQMSLAVESLNEDELLDVNEKIDKLSKQFRDNALSIRLVPISDMIIRFKRLVRDLSKSLNKKVEFITQGTETELDKNIIDVLAEPIMHIIRNCIDHGIEPAEERLKDGKQESGLIKLTAFHSGSNVFIQIQDDGQGIDPEKIKRKAIEKNLISPEEKISDKDIYNFLFLPGFSTAENVTEVSGRGVGMDVVKRKITEVRGEVEIDSEIGLGTIFTIKLQQTISILDTLLLKVSNSYFLLPLSEVEVCEQELHKQLFAKASYRFEYNDDLIPFIYLREEFELNGTIPEKHKIVVIKKDGKRIGLLADRIIGEHQAVLKPLGEMFSHLQYISGASILGDGNLALMLDTAKLMKRKNV